MAVKQPVRDKFWEYVQVGSENECWPWQGSKTHGYGVLDAGHKTMTAHRFAYELVNGPVADGLEVRHTCDNRPCCNPAHLLTGTRQDNNQDRRDRNRSARGEKSASARLTEAQVSEIRRLRLAGDEYWKIAEKYSISISTARAAARGKTWKCVPCPVAPPQRAKGNQYTRRRTS